jgi:hypothetical protein
MSKIGRAGTIFSIIFGFIFIAWAIVFILWFITSQSSRDGNVLCLLAAIPVLIYGIILVFWGIRQFKGIKEGKEFTGPRNDLK